MVCILFIHLSIFKAYFHSGRNNYFTFGTDCYVLWLADSMTLLTETSPAPIWESFKMYVVCMFYQLRFHNARCAPVSGRKSPSERSVHQKLEQEQNFISNGDCWFSPVSADKTPTRPRRTWHEVFSTSGVKSRLRAEARGANVHNIPAPQTNTPHPRENSHLNNVERRGGRSTTEERKWHQRSVEMCLFVCLLLLL